MKIKIEVISQLNALLSEIRIEAKDKYQTNYFGDFSELIDANNCVYIYDQHKTLICVQTNKNFSKLFYWTNSFASLGFSLKTIDSPLPQIIENISRGQMDENLVKCLRSAGFENVVNFDRYKLQGIQIENSNLDLLVEPANETESFLIHQYLCEEFDELYENIPSLMKVREFVLEKQVLVIRSKSGDIRSFLIFQNRGNSSELKYLWVSKSMRGRGAGRAILETYLYRNLTCTTLTLWVMESNSTAIKLYTKVGYQRDNLRDYVFEKRTK